MKRLLAIAATGALLFLSTAAADATGRTHLRPHHRLHTMTVTFRLHVIGQPTRGTTYWVAYGPLADHWGIVQLHDNGKGLETASVSLPTAGRTTFSYLAGQGVIHARVGLVPGDPITTIETVGPISVAQLDSRPVEWLASIG